MYTGDNVSDKHYRHRLSRDVQAKNSQFYVYEIESVGNIVKISKNDRYRIAVTN